MREQQCSPNLGSTCLPRPCLLVPFSKFLPVGHPSFLRQDCAWPGLTAQAQPPFCFLTRGPLGPRHRVGAPGERPRGRKLCCPVGGHRPPSRILAQSSTARFRFHLNLWFSWPHRHLHFKACSQWDGGQHPKVSLEPPVLPRGRNGSYLGGSCAAAPGRPGRQRPGEARAFHVCTERV